jgi:hypothetical protein
MRGGAILLSRVTPPLGFALQQAAGHRERAALTTRPHRGSASEDALRGKIILPACSSGGETPSATEIFRGGSQLCRQFWATCASGHP